MDNSAVTPERALPSNNESLVSGISWAAVVAGAFVTASLSLTLMVLGAGMGLSSVSPWPNGGLSSSRVAPVAIVWIIFVQIAASALGGYLAGRLRTKWVQVHTHEVFFRDTAHGFLVWAVALVITAAFLSSIGTAIAKDMSNLPGSENPSDYFVDALFRGEQSVADKAIFAQRSEVRLILARALLDPEMSPPDQAYLTTLVALRTGLPHPEATKRVTDTVAADRQAADYARKAVAHSLYWMFVALLIGAFCASYAATIGGRQRDHVPSV